MSAELGTVYFFLNTRVAPFADVRVRRAFSIAFDREALARAVGRAGVPTCRIFPRNSLGYRPTCSFDTGGVANLDRARRVVASSDAVGTRVTVWMPDRAPRKVGRYVVSLLSSLGFRARLQVEPIRGDPAYFDKVSDSRTGAQIGWAGWGADYPSAGGIIAPLLSCAAFVPASPVQNTNLAGFCDRSIDAQMRHASAAQVQDPAVGMTLWQQIEDALLAQAPIVPAYNRSYVTFVSERVGNYQYNPQWGVLLGQLWVR